VKLRTADVDVTQLCNDTTRAAVHVATLAVASYPGLLADLECDDVGTQSDCSPWLWSCSQRKNCGVLQVCPHTCIQVLTRPIFWDCTYS